jgi:hypothetical protein
MELASAVNPDVLLLIALLMLVIAAEFADIDPPLSETEFDRVLTVSDSPDIFPLAVDSPLVRVVIDPEIDTILPSVASTLESRLLIAPEFALTVPCKDVTSPSTSLRSLDKEVIEPD